MFVFHRGLLTGSLAFTKLLIYNIFVHQCLRHAKRSLSAKSGQAGPYRNLYKNVALNNTMNKYVGVNLNQFFNVKVKFPLKLLFHLQI